MTAYVGGGVGALLVGLLNPEGIAIVVVSALASSLGGTSGLLWMMQLLDRKHPTGLAPAPLGRNLRWLVFSLVCIVVYAAVFGPTINV